MRFIYVLLVVVVAVLGVARGTLYTLGNLYIVTPQRIETDPHAGYRNQREFASKHGPRGALLIEALGNGKFHHHNYASRRHDLPPPFFYDLLR